MLPLNKMVEREESSARIFGLDLMRAIAILVVMYMHGMFLLPVTAQWYYNIPLPAMDGVSVFFVLSGFLIGGILLRILEKPTYSLPEIGDFWIRRWFRTLPNYLLVLTAVVVIYLLTGQALDNFHWGFYFFTQNFAGPHPEFFPEAWSLCVEEWFYLGLPVLVFLFSFLLPMRRYAVLLVALVILIVPFILRIQQYQLYGSDPLMPTELRKIVILRLDSLMYGVLMAYAYRYRREWCLKYRKLGLVLSLLMVILMTINMRFLTNGPLYRVIFIPSLEPLAAMLALPFLASWQTLEIPWLAKLIRFISTISYSMYLLNLTIVQHTILPMMTGDVSWNNQPSLSLGLLRLALFWLITIVLAWSLYYFFERPMRDMRDKVKFLQRPAAVPSVK